MIPSYRIRIYCLIGVLLASLGMVVFVSDLLGALFYQRLHALTGPRYHRVWEDVTLAANPVRFCGYFVFVAFGAAVSIYGTYKLGRGVVLGRRAYRAWENQGRDSLNR